MKTSIAISALALAAIAGSANASLIGGFNTGSVATDPTYPNWALWGTNRRTSATIDGVLVTPTEGARFALINANSTLTPIDDWGVQYGLNVSLNAGDIITFDYFAPAGGSVQIFAWDVPLAASNFQVFGSTNGVWATVNWTVPQNLPSGGSYAFSIFNNGLTEVALDNVRLNIPTPGAAALLGLGGLMAARRRR